MNFVYKLGKDFTQSMSYIGGITSLFAFSFLELFNRKKEGRRLIRQIITKQIFFTGYQALGPISVIALVVGFIIIVLQGFTATTAASGFLTVDKMGSLLVTIIVREIGPLLTAIILLGRSGTAVATEIGNMMASDEFDALESLGVDPLRYIVYPRLVGIIVSLFCLVIYFDIVGLMGGYLAATLTGMTIPFSEFFNSLFANFGITDLMVVLFKCFTMGGAMAVISVMEGFKVGRQARMVPVAATRTVVNSLIALFLVDGIITAVSYI
jgi:phospholipid/cholesterol/gamma-HCH transport system permease protein